MSGGIFQLLLASVVLQIAAGCDRDSPSTSTQTAGAAFHITGTGVVTGRVRLTGALPARPPIDVSGVADCAKRHPDGIPDESVVVDPDGDLANCIVYVRGLPAEAPVAGPIAVLDQRGCRYEPHVLALHTGQTLNVRSADPFLHNVHLMCSTNAADNFSELARTGEVASRDVHFERPEIFAVRCDVHPWMRAWIGVFDHPCFGVTDRKGNFRVEHVPAGQYELVVWQERLGELSKEFSVKDGGAATVDFDYSP